MFRNYIHVVLRTIRKQPGYSLITIGGLGLGLACTFLILLFIQHERSFDRFHENGDRIFRLLLSDGTDGSGEMQAISASGHAVALTDAFPEIEATVRTFSTSPYLNVGERAFAASGFLFADDPFYEVFSFPLLRGDAESVLTRPNALVLTETAARRMFGAGDPVGKVVRYNDQFELEVTGVMQDVPANSHLEFDYVANFKSLTSLMGPDALDEFTNYNYYTYVLLTDRADVQQLEARFPAFVDSRFADGGGSANNSLHLQPLADIHFATDIKWDVPTNTDPKYVYILAVVAALLLLIACVNFMNLATARAARRAKEVGVRKAVGAERRQLVAQFLGESVMLSLFSIVLAVLLTLASVSLFERVIDREISLMAVGPGALALLIGVGLLAGLLAGSYPAFYLAAFRPARVLKGEIQRSGRGTGLRRGLIVVQFGISIFLIIGTLTIERQLDFVRSMDLGFQKEQVLFAPLVAPLREQFEVFRDQALAQPGVLNVARAGNLPGRVNTSRGYNWPGQSADEQEGRGFYTVLADPHFIETLGLQIVSGRNFSEDMPTDFEDAYILNETAVRELGWENPIDHPFRAWDREMGSVIGVVEDFHFKSLHQQIEPVVINIKPGWLSYVVIRLAPGQFDESVSRLRAQWEMLAPGFPFDYRFLDQDFERLYRSEQNLGRLFTFFATIAILVACLGLFGLAAYSAEQRTKEIGVRKVLGASVQSIVIMLSREFTLLVLIGFAVAAPVAYLLMNRWLDAFAYRAEWSVATFVSAVLAALMIAWLTVSYQSIKAAVANPVKALKYE